MPLKGFGSAGGVREGVWEPFGSSLATLTGGPVGKIRFVNAFGGVGAFSCIRVASRGAFG